MLPEGTAAHLKKGSWPQTELFAWLQKTAGIDDIEMNRTFNNGIGMVVVVDAANAEATAATLRAAGRAGVHHRHDCAARRRCRSGRRLTPHCSTTTRMAQHQPPALSPEPPPAALTTYTAAPPPLRPVRSGVVLASYLLMGGALLLVMWRGLLPGLLCVCLGFLLTRALTAWIAGHAAAARRAAQPPSG